MDIWKYINIITIGANELPILGIISLTLMMVLILKSGDFIKNKIKNKFLAIISLLISWVLIIITVHLVVFGGYIYKYNNFDKSEIVLIKYSNYNNKNKNIENEK